MSIYCEVTSGASTHLLQKASQVPLVLIGLRCLASLTSTCSWPPLALRSDLEAADLILPPNLRRLDELPVRLEPRENIEDFRFSGGMYFRPTTMSPRYVATSSNGSLCERKKKSILEMMFI